jgi:hypothetical protein
MNYFMQEPGARQAKLFEYIIFMVDIILKVKTPVNTVKGEANQMQVLMQ